MQWILVVGFGNHIQVDPIHRPARKAVEVIVLDKLQLDANSKWKDILKGICDAYGINASRASIRKELFIQRKLSGGFGNSMEQLIRKFNIGCNDSDAYVLCVVDERGKYGTRKSTE